MERLRTVPTARELAIKLFHAALAAVDGRRLVAGAFADRDRPSQGAGLSVLAVGKAARAMAAGALDSAQPSIVRALVVAGDVPPDQAEGRFPAGPWPVLSAGHPLPDARGLLAARAVERFVEETDGELLVLLSGGASAMLPAPAGEVTLDDKIAVTAALLRAGASIGELNAVRKHVSRIKGGGLVQRLRPGIGVRVWALSDVIGDDPSVIASGPLSADASTYAEALATLERYGVDRTARSITRHLERGARGELEETLRADDPRLRDVRYRVLAGNGSARAAIAETAQELGLRGTVRAKPVLGEARVAGALLARELLASTVRLGVAISGGETTVTVTGNGLGGRNQELALGFVLEAERLLAETASGDRDPGDRDQVEWAFFSAGTDGRDGPTDAAGALVDSATLARARRVGLSPSRELANNNSYRVLEAAGDLVRTGATGTNVADLQIFVAAAVLSPRVAVPC